MNDKRNPDGAALGRIRTKRVAVPADRANPRAPSSHRGADPRMNRLVPYLDLFARLTDDELARLGQVPLGIVAQMRKQVDEVCRALGRYADLLERLSDGELSRLTGANVKTIRFWRLCQPRGPGVPEPVDTQISSTADIGVDPSSSARMRRAEVTGSPSAGVPVSTAGSATGSIDRTPVVPSAPQKDEADFSDLGIPEDDDDLILTVQE